MRSPLFLAILAVLSAGCHARADTLIQYSVNGYGSVYVPTSDEDGNTFYGPTSGTATFDVNTQTFTNFSLSTYEGSFDTGWIQPNVDPCYSVPFYTCVDIYGDSSSGFTFAFADLENMIFFDDGSYDRIQEQYTGTLSPIAATPEPGSFALLATGLLGVAGPLRRKYSC